MATLEGQEAGPTAPAARRPAIVFIGFMGAGKTAAANAARAAGLEAIEADELLEGELGMPIARFFGRRGEEEFRSLESAQVSKLLDEADGGVIALGGGAVCSERGPRGARAAMSSSGSRCRRRRPGGGWRGATGPWPRTAATSRPCTPSASRSTRSSPTRSFPPATRRWWRGRCPR